MRVNRAGDETKTELDAGELEQRQSELDAGALEQRRMPSTPDGEPVFSHRSRASRSSSSRKPSKTRYKQRGESEHPASASSTTYAP